MNWTAVIEYRRWEETETIIGPLRSIECHLRQHAEEIIHVDLSPVIEMTSDSYMSLDGDLNRGRDDRRGDRAAGDRRRAAVPALRGPSRPGKAVRLRPEVRRPSMQSERIMNWKKEMPKITEVQRFRYEPGDRFILRFKGGMVEAQQAAEIAKQFRAAMQLPGDCPVVVLDDSWDLTVTNDTVKVTPGAPAGHEAEQR